MLKCLNVKLSPLFLIALEREINLLICVCRCVNSFVCIYVACLCIALEQTQLIELKCFTEFIIQTCKNS